MFRFFRSGQQDRDQEQQQQRQPLLQPDQIPYQSSYDSISENEVLDCCYYLFLHLSINRAHILCSILFTFSNLLM